MHFGSTVKQLYTSTLIFQRSGNDFYFISRSNCTAMYYHWMFHFCYLCYQSDFALGQDSNPAAEAYKTNDMIQFVHSLILVNIRGKKNIIRKQYSFYYFFSVAPLSNFFLYGHNGFDVQNLKLGSHHFFTTSSHV